MPWASDVIDLTQANTNATLSAGVANTESEVARFTVPRRTFYQLLPSVSTISLNLADTTPTQLAGSSRVRITVEDPNGVMRTTIYDGPYTALREFQDRNLKKTVAQEVRLKPDDVVRFFVTGNLAAAASQTQFMLGSVRRWTEL